MKKVLSIFLTFCLLLTASLTTFPEKAIASKIDVVLIKCEQENSCPNGYGVIAGAVAGYAISQNAAVATGAVAEISAITTGVTGAVAEISAIATGATVAVAGLGASMATATTPLIIAATPFVLPVIATGAVIGGGYIIYQNFFNSEKISE